uniref:Uncharacterized protein n=1 Tax=Tetraselmis sp. GSL018 TaxID=582737 RepID=A0A061R0N5_9CHLO|mmetsp:Transcript_19783/g.47207  ORF Transcript_19783/g.47207 Transcript_19783/m.47207 type:complete len:296 (-) Transcript_19783:301-1188(-)|eukprot:CAMPEP_0177609416 /NCGR_PEP_ID=MMETSP0419_2-20121207/19074_1 /TAXON_ID=582737 /ORGANISM="Tetraselmis sp., Strain GSL018" /LENGTH=295 /DNA_ID=CAMNT_0019104333 /DNA_START=364 /DNA_END=1251 /DNA_ORIENTATION=+
MGCATSKPETKDDENTGKPNNVLCSDNSTAAAGVEEENQLYSSQQPAQTFRWSGSSLRGRQPTVPEEGPTEHGTEEHLNSKDEPSDREDEDVVSIEALLAGTKKTNRPYNLSQARAARRSTDSEMVEQLDVFNYTEIKSPTSGAGSRPQMKFQVDGVHSQYEVGKSTSMEQLLKASRRAATYHGAGAAGGQLPIDEEREGRRRSHLEKVKQEMLIERNEDGELQYNFNATHQALQGLQWATYFSQEGGDQAAPAESPVVEEPGGGPKSLEQLLAEQSGAGQGGGQAAARRASALA